MRPLSGRPRNRGKGVGPGMIPLQFAGELVGWLWAVVALLVPGVVATAFWTPFLAAGRIRALFDVLPPSGSVLPSYVLAGLAASVPFLVAVFGVLAAGGSGADLSSGLLTRALLLTVAYTAGLPLVAGLLLPRLGVDWDPTGYGPSTWLLLAAGGCCYALLFAVPIVLLSVVFALPGGY